MIHANGVLEQILLNGSSYVVTSRNEALEPTVNMDLNFQIVEDLDGDLWVYLLNDNRGIYFFDKRRKKFKHIDKDSPGLHLNTNLVSGCVVDDHNAIWVGTDHGGINIIDKKHQKAYTVQHLDEDLHGLGQNSITTLYRDRQGVIWVGTFKQGISYYHENLVRFPVFQHSLFDKSSLPFNDVNRFVEDKKGNVWIGTNGGGLIYFDRTHNSFKQFQSDPKNENSLSSDVIVSLLIDDQDILWIGTFYGGLNSFDGRIFRRYLPGISSTTISGRSVWEIFEDSRKQLWIGTLDAGLDLLDRKTGTFTHYKSGQLTPSSQPTSHP